MKTPSKKEFIALLETIVTEASSAINIVKNSPKALQLLKYLHQNEKLPHDIQFSPEDKIAWTEFSSGSWGPGSAHWIIVTGTIGTAVIKSKIGRSRTSRSFNVYGVDSEGEILARRFDSGADAMKYAKSLIGRTTGYYASVRDPESIEDLKATRQKNRAIKQDQFESPDQFALVMMTKMRPLWLKALHAAHSDVKGFIVSQLKNNALHKADQKLKKLQKIDELITTIENDDGTIKKNPQSYPQVLTGAMLNAINMTAYHYYPELSREFRRTGYGNLHSVSLDALRQLFDDIRAGDTSKISTIIAFFRQGLLHT